MTTKTFKTILIANRGEIARRIIRTCKELGIKTVAIYAEADKASPHVQEADVAVSVGQDHVATSYLNQDAILEAARANNVDAIHPGYGLLSENADFARRVEQEGIVFIGPRPETIELMGDKAAARKVAMKAGVAVVPGSDGPVSQEEATAIAEEIGFPVLVKAAAGGGGIGMQVASKPKKLEKAIAASKRRSASSFGNDDVYLERYIEHPKHIEVQILADTHGNVVHLFERECSIQRRHQKVIEEAPSPAATTFPNLRQEITQAAVALAKEVGYHNAGTIEFIVAPTGEFYFIEMNTRLQVEHPVTEAITHVDLVALQIKIAQGERLDFAQEDVKIDGHAIECRVYAENPEKSFMPAPGHIADYSEPTGDGVRVDSGVTANYDVTPYYDPMIAKLCVHGHNREDAREKLLAALNDFTIEPLTHNIELHKKVIASKPFIDGEIDTLWLEDFVKVS